MTRSDGDVVRWEMGVARWGGKDGCRADGPLRLEGARQMHKPRPKTSDVTSRPAAHVRMHLSSQDSRPSSLATCRWSSHRIQMSAVADPTRA